MEKDFENFLRENLKLFFSKRAEELIRIKTEHFYVINSNSLRTEKDQKRILEEIDREIETVVDIYIKRLKDAKLDTPEKLRNDTKNVEKITNEIEKELEKRLKQ